MASQWPSDPDSVLRGMFGNFVAAAESGGRGAVNMWNALHDAAGEWASSVLAVAAAGPVTPDMVQATAQRLIGRVTIQDMNTMAETVGKFLRAKQNLQQQGMDQQIVGSSIFEPPWASTIGNPAVPTRYRIVVLRDITVRGFTLINRSEWASYELTGPLTTLGDALSQANTLFAQADYNVRASIDAIREVHIEAI